jgi:N-acyl-phosphatidylethanolamine-hydrolysing phospholipase D
MNQTAMSLTLAGALALLQGCTFARIGVRNVPVFFKRPTHISQIGRLKASSGARVSATWIGHATVLLKIDDKFILTDPVFTSTIGGLSRRLVEPEIGPSKMPVLDLVLISHRHLDHLSPASLELLGSRVQTVIVPPGAAKNFSRPSYAIMELSVGEQTSKADIRISAVRVLHTGGRIHDAKTHPDAFVGYVLECHGFTVYFPGDNGVSGKHLRERSQAVQAYRSRHYAHLPDFAPIANVSNSHESSAGRYGRGDVRRPYDASRPLRDIHQFT